MIKTKHGGQLIYSADYKKTKAEKKSIKLSWLTIAFIVYAIVAVLLVGTSDKAVYLSTHLIK